MILLGVKLYHIVQICPNKEAALLFVLFFDMCEGCGNNINIK